MKKASGHDKTHDEESAAVRKKERRTSAKKKEATPNSSSSISSEHHKPKHTHSSSSSGKEKKKGHHHHHHHNNNKDSDSDEKPAIQWDKMSSSEHSQHTNPDYNWETHSHASGATDSSSKNNKRFHEGRMSTTIAVEDFDFLQENKEHVFDVALDEDNEGGMLETAERSSKMEANRPDARNHNSSFEMSFEQQQEEEFDEEEFAKAEDEALQTKPALSPSPIHRDIAAVSISSPRAVVSKSGTAVKCNLSPPNLHSGLGVEGPLPGSPVKRNSLLKLGGPQLHANSSFIPQFLVEADDDDDDEEEDDEGEEKKQELHHALNASVSTSSSTEWEWAVPEADGLDEAIPEINAKRHSSLL